MPNHSKSEELKRKLHRSLAESAPPDQALTATAPAPAGPLPCLSSPAGESAGAARTPGEGKVADRIIMTSTLAAAGGGAIPVPGWDMAAVMAVQLKMLADLSEVHGVPFSRDAGLAALGTLIGGLAPGVLARGSLGAALKFIPGVGQVFGVLALPALAGGCTYALGKVFVAHYESGGTLLSFNAKDFSARFAAEVKAGMANVASLKI